MPSYKLCPICKKKRIDFRSKKCRPCYRPEMMANLDKMNVINKANPNSGAFKRGNKPWNVGISGLSGGENSQWTGGETVNASGYVFKIVSYTKNGAARYRLKHRWVMDQYLKSFDKKFIVHHVDGNKLNNDIGNLRLMTYKEHNQEHSRLRRLAECERLKKFTSVDQSPQ